MFFFFSNYYYNISFVDCNGLLYPLCFLNLLAFLSVPLNIKRTHALEVEFEHTCENELSWYEKEKSRWKNEYAIFMTSFLHCNQIKYIWCYHCAANFLAQMVSFANEICMFILFNNPLSHKYYVEKSYIMILLIKWIFSKSLKRVSC